MKFTIGLDDFAYRQKKEQMPVNWDSSQVVNPHILIAGKSGTGKTHTIRKLINDCIKTGGKNTTFHVMDVHGDIEIPGSSTVLFSESTQYGINPLKINPDPDFGGVRKRIQSFLSTLNRTQSRVLGPKQEAVLRNLITDLYAANGFYAEKPASWRLDDGMNYKYPKKFPNIEDAHRFAYSKLKQMFLGTSTSTIKNLDDLNRKSSLMQSRIRKLNGAKSDEVRKIEEDIAALSEKSSASFNEYISTITTGQELDTLIKYDSQDVLKSVVDRLENMKATGIFKNQQPPFEVGNPVWRYDIRALDQEEKRMFVEFTLQDIFAKAMQRGPVNELLDIIILDEAHLFFKDDEDNILNTLAKEARKFGVALICASQSPTDFSDDFLSNVATKILLGIDQMYWDQAVRRMRIDPKMLTYLVPQKTIAAQIGNKGESKTVFKQVHVGPVY